MKKMIFGLAALASLATLATTVESSNTFGVLKLMSNDEETAICVPWVKVGTGTDPIEISSLVLTSNLKIGDELYAFGNQNNDAVTYKWTLTEDNSGNKTWGSATTTISGSGSSTAAEKTTIKRGLGLILVRGTSKTGDYSEYSWPTTGEGSLAKTPIYLYGQHADLTTAEKSTTCPVSTTKALSTLIAPPSTAEVDLNSGVTFTGAKPNDMIMTQLGTTYYYTYPVSDHVKENALKWCTMSPSDNDTDTINWVTTGVTIPAGRGAWYIARKRTEAEGSTTPVTITWAN